MMSTLILGREAQYERLQSLLSEDMIDEDNIKNILDSLNLRHGSFGSERKILLNTLFKNLIENMLPFYAKFLMQVSEETEEENEDTYEKQKKLSKYQLNEHMKKDLKPWDELMGILNSTAIQQRKLVEHRENVIKSKKTYAEVVKQLMEIKLKLFQAGANIDKSFEDMKENVLNPE